MNASLSKVGSSRVELLSASNGSGLSIFVNHCCGRCSDRFIFFFFLDYLLIISKQL